MSKDVQPLVSLFRLGISIHNFNKKSEEKVGLSLVQWCLLEQLIDMPGTSAHALAKSVGIHPSTLTQTLKRLEKKGFLFQAEDPKDSRKKIISITIHGKQAMERIASQKKDWTKCLTPVSNDLQKLNAVLQAMVNYGS
ncbi:MAG: MarR family transcriptional regulator [Deltaproteobacteria bacterium]|nr:MarR family transcriptional regulator [Deltaproteobacteria bacterium]